MPVRGQDAVTAVEYALVIGLLSIAILVAVVFLADQTCDVHEANARSIRQQSAVMGDGGGCAGVNP